MAYYFLQISLDPNPPSRVLYGKYVLNPLINRDALESWRQLELNSVDHLNNTLYKE